MMKLEIPLETQNLFMISLRTYALTPLSRVLHNYVNEVLNQGHLVEM